MASNPQTTKPIVIVHQLPSGFVEISFHGDVDIYQVDENAPNDRVYKLTHPASVESIFEIIGDSKIGHCGDDRHRAISYRLSQNLGGKDHLEIVE